MRARAEVPRRRGPERQGRSLVGLTVTWLGGLLGAVASIVALLVGLYALSYGAGEFRIGGYDYGCVDQACTTGHSLVAVLCFASVLGYVLLVALALSTSVRLLRTGMRIGFIGAALVLATSVVLSLGDDWRWLVILALPPALMGLGSDLRLRAEQRRLRA